MQWLLENANVLRIIELLSFYSDSICMHQWPLLQLDQPVKGAAAAEQNADDTVSDPNDRSEMSADTAGNLPSTASQTFPREDDRSYFHVCKKAQPRPNCCSY